MKKKLDKWIPRYSRIPLLLLILANTITYNGTKLYTNHLFHYNAATKIDSYIPFVPFFISFYILAYLQWIIGYIIITRENKKTCYKYVSAGLIAKFLCFIFFILFPTTLIRPIISGNSILETLTKLVYKLDAPVNLFPSIHCLESWMCFRGSLSLKKVPKGYKLIMFIFTVFVCASTVLVKQHVFIDIIGGIMVVEIGIFLANKLNTGKILEKINQKLKVKKCRGSCYEARK